MNKRLKKKIIKEAMCLLAHPGISDNRGKCLYTCDALLEACNHFGVMMYETTALMKDYWHSLDWYRNEWASVVCRKGATAETQEERFLHLCNYYYSL